jgi:transposase
VVERIVSRGDLVSFFLRRGGSGADCPACGTGSVSVHGCYQRRLVDTALCGRRVELRLTVRRFRCREASCASVTFAERFEDLTCPYSRFTTTARTALTEIGLALAGRAGARLTVRLGLPAGRTVLLDLVRAVPEIARTTSPALLGIDEFALRRGRIYGTVLIDVTTHRPVDLLPDREVGTVTAWLKDHPGTTAICRDRAGGFAEAGRLGAPGAIHIADRWHLWHNLGEAVERCVAAHSGCLHTPDQAETKSAASVDTRPPSKSPHRFTDRVQTRHAAVHALLAQGRSLRAIGTELGLARGTVRRYARADDPEQLLHDQWQNLPSHLDPFKPYLHQRIADGHDNARILHDELRERGFTGTYGTVRAWVGLHRQPQAAPAAKPPSTRAVTGLITRHPDTLDEDEQIQLKTILGRCPELDTLADHVRDFAAMMVNLDGHLLDDWITAAQSTDLPPLRSFARGLLSDYDAVRNGLTLPHSSGVVEGHVNRIKMLKRQMYGRANFDLLRKRVLYSR